MSDLEKHDFSELEARVLKPLQLKKLKRGCEAGHSFGMCHGNVTFQEIGKHESDKDFEFIGEKETAIAHEEAGNTNGKRPATAGAEAEASPKKLMV